MTIVKPFIRFIFGLFLAIYSIVYASSYKNQPNFYFRHLATGKKTSYLKCSKMDKLIEAEEMFFDSPAAGTSEKVDFEVNADKYRDFLRINPIWSYLGLSKEEYFRLGVQEKTSHIQRYYRHMLEGEHFFFYLFICCLLFG